MEIKRCNSSASDLVSHWDSISTIKRPERNTEMLIQSTELLNTVFYTVYEKVITKQRQLGKKPSSKCVNWLLKAAEIQTQVHEMLESKEHKSNVLTHSRMYMPMILSIIYKIQSLTEKSPYGYGSVAHVALMISKTITSPARTSEAYRQILEMQQYTCLPTPATPSRDSLTQTRSEVKASNAAPHNEGSPTLPGEAYEQTPQMQQGICLHTPTTPPGDAITETTEAENMNGASLDGGGPTLTGEAYGQIQEMQQYICLPSPATPSRDSLTQTRSNVKASNAASDNEGGPTVPREAYGQIPEIQQDICLHTPATPATETMADISDARTKNAPSENDGGGKEHLLNTGVEKSREPAINQAVGEIPSRNEGGEAMVEADADRKSELETGNVACQNEGGGSALQEARISAVVSSKRILRKILKCMKESTTSSIAIYGIGGIGKTTTLKDLVDHVKNMFDVVIWVNVSRDWSPRKIQNEMVSQLELSLPDNQTDFEVAEHLSQFLSNINFLFIMDDVWERVDFTELGIPDPRPEKVFSRIIVASRLLDVCKEMAGKRVFEMEPFSSKEAWALFHKQAGDIVEARDIRRNAKDIVRECGGLPLLIIVTGRAMREVNDVQEWKNALKKLELPRKLGKSGNGAVMQRLKFSFDSLKSSEIKRCFMYCASFPEDHEVEKSELVRFCIAEGLISGNLGDKRGHDMVESLVDASLLQSTRGDLAIKMHDLLRELALRITLSGEEGPYSKVVNSSIPGSSSICRPPEFSNPQKEGPESRAMSIPEGYQFLSRAGAGLMEPPPEEKWEHAKMIALMDNQLSRLPDTPRCPDLQKLFLQRNRNLRMVPAYFFECMPALEVLNLSNTRIKFLPQSIYKLKRLKVLILRNCERLVVLPSEIGSLEALEVLDLHGTELDGLPDEIAALSCLRHLEVSFYGSIIPDEYACLPPDLVSNGILSSLISLETLSIEVYPGDQRWMKSVRFIVDDICHLKNLGALSFYFPEVELLRNFIQTCPTWKDNLLTKFKFVVGCDVKRIVPRVPKYVVNDYDQQGQCLRFVNGEKIDDVIEALARTAAFYLDHHLTVKSLSEFGVRNLSGLKLCTVSECPAIQSIVNCEDLTKPVETVFPSLEYLSIHYSWNLKCIWKGTVPDKSLSKLRILMVHACPGLEFVLTTSMLSCLENLEELVVEDCSAVEVIICQDGIKSFKSDLAPRLRRLTLSTLPELVTICKGGWPAVIYSDLFNCPKFEKNPTHSHVQVRCRED